MVVKTEAEYHRQLKHTAVKYIGRISIQFVSITLWGFQDMLMEHASMAQVQIFALIRLCFFIVFNDETCPNV